MAKIVCIMAKRKEHRKPGGKTLPDASNQRDNLVPFPNYDEATVTRIAHWVKLADKVLVGNNVRKKA